MDHATRNTQHATAIIVAAGKGTRMGPNVDKLFLEVAGKPIVVHTWQRFAQARCIDEIILVVRDGMHETMAVARDLRDAIAAVRA